MSPVPDGYNLHAQRLHASRALLDGDGVRRCHLPRLNLEPGRAGETTML